MWRSGRERDGRSEPKCFELNGECSSMSRVRDRESRCDANANFVTHPTRDGRVVQASVCKTEETSAILVPASILRARGVDTYTPVFQTGVLGGIPS